MSKEMASTYSQEAEQSVLGAIILGIPYFIKIFID